eukprot:scaffold110397_cov25-Tisochrysis_lutea.AAC.1
MESDKVKILRLMSAGGATWLLDAPHWRCCRSSQVACEVSHAPTSTYPPSETDLGMSESGNRRRFLFSGVERGSSGERE